MSDLVKSITDLTKSLNQLTSLTTDLTKSMNKLTKSVADLTKEVNDLVKSFNKKVNLAADWVNGLYKFSHFAGKCLKIWLSVACGCLKPGQFGK